MLRIMGATAVLLLSLLGACGGCLQGSQAPNSAGALQPISPSQSATLLPRLEAIPGGPALPRSDSFVDSDLLCLGEDFDPALPSQNVEGFAAQQAAFKPQQSDGGGLKGLAFALYRFDVPGYNLEPKLHFSWSISPGLAGSGNWVALTNWQRPGWDVFPFSNAGCSLLELDDLSSYFDASGRLYLAVLLGGSQEAYLKQIRLGGVPPQPQLSATPRRGAPPLQVHLDASASLPGVGNITSYEWDPEGDGSFLPGAAELDWLYETEGSFNATVRVSNELGNQASASILVQPGHFWQRSFGFDISESINGVAVDAQDNVYLAATQFNPEEAADSRILVLKLDPAGQLLWSRLYETEFNGVFCSAAAVDSAGNLLVSGTEYIGDLNAQCLLLKWSPAGDLIWSRIYGAEEGDYSEALRCEGSDIWLCGGTNQPSDVLLCKVLADGTIQYLRSRDLGSVEQGVDLDFKYSITSELSGVTVLARQLLPGGGQLAHVDYDADGDFNSAGVLADNSLPREPGHIYYRRNLLTAETRYTVSGTVEINSLAQPFVLVLPPSGDSTAGCRISGLDCNRQGGLLSDGSGGQYLGLSARIPGGDGTLHSCLLHVLGDGSLASALQMEAGGHYNSTRSLLPYKDGLLLGGYGPDAFGAYVPAISGSQVYSDEWVDTPGSSSNPQWTTAPGNGTVSDAATGLVQDSGAGSFDVMLSFVPLPQ
ncbi:hypothetical protein IT575_05340 [bacterium]|nr:hypothetical protein [bacterium]